MDTRTPDQAVSSSGGADTCHTIHGYINDKDRYLARLKRIEGQARGLHSMVDEEQYCIDILTQTPWSMLPYAALPSDYSMTT